MSREQLDALFQVSAGLPADGPHSDLSARELLQLAYDRAESELTDLQDQLRELLQRHKTEQGKLEAKIAKQKRLLREIAERG